MSDEESEIELSNYELSLIVNAVTIQMNFHLEKRDKEIERTNNPHTVKAFNHNMKRIHHKQILDALAKRHTAATYVLTIKQEEEEDNG